MDEARNLNSNQKPAGLFFACCFPARTGFALVINGYSGVVLLPVYASDGDQEKTRANAYRLVHTYSQGGSWQRLGVKTTADT